MGADRKLRNEFPLAAAFTRIPIRETAIPTAYSNSIEDSTHSDYVENYTLEVKYWLKFYQVAYETMKKICKLLQIII